DQDQKINTSDLKLEDCSRKSPSVAEVMMTTVSKKTKEQEKSADDSSDEMMKPVEGQIVTGTLQEVSVIDQSEHEEAKNTSKDSAKVLLISIFTIIMDVFVSWYFHRSLSSVHLKKKAKAVAPAAPVSSQYLGTLKVLEDTCVQNSTEFHKADSLRAAVFQNWLEKKRAFLLELKRIEKKKAEDLRKDAEKKEAIKREEANASFEAWKRKKEREAKQLSEKKKLEEHKKKKTAEQDEDKTEAAQKMQYLVCYMMIPSLSLYRNEKKDEYIKQKKVEKILERRKQEIQQAKNEEENKKAIGAYERWLEKKERREQLEKKQKKLQALHRDGVPSPWSPPGKVTY
ncbi:MAP9 protein, partial [Pterocles burchelli]|nr:MAP9 protein [Pterocles burchelli]